MYVTDTGRTGFFGSMEPWNVCPAKIVVIDLNTDAVIESHPLSDIHVSRSNNFLNDIVLDFESGRVRFAYMSDTVMSRLIGYDFWNRTTISVNHVMMRPEPGDAPVITINGESARRNAGINGIAMSWDLRHVFFSSLGGYNLYQVPTSSLRRLFDSPTNVDRVHDGRRLGIRRVGRKVSQSDGLTCGRRNLYFGALGLNAVYFWDFEQDVTSQEVPIDDVEMRSQYPLVRNDWTMQWPDSLSLDASGWLWFMASKVNQLEGGQIDFTGSSGSNFRVWKVFVNDTGYIYNGDIRTNSIIN